MKVVRSGKNLIVKKPENLVQARYSLSPLAIKFLSAVIASIKRGDDLNEEYVIKVADFKELTGQKTKRIYELVEEALRDLLNSPLKIPIDKNGTKFLMTNWVSSAIYDAGEVSFLIDKRLRPFLLEVKEKYLKYKLENILRLRSSYSIRLYEILKDWLELNERYGKKKEKIISVEEFREILGIPKSYRYNNIKKQVIEKAKEELAKHTDILFDFEEIKSGRKVTHVKFIIKPNPKKVEVKESDSFENRASFVELLRQNYGGKRKFWGYNAIDGKSYWLGINSEGLMYGESEDGLLIHPDRFQSSNIYDLWLKVAQHSQLYRDLIQEGIDLRKLKQTDQESWELFEEEIKRLKSERVI